MLCLIISSLSFPEPRILTRRHLLPCIVLHFLCAVCSARCHNLVQEAARRVSQACSEVEHSVAAAAPAEQLQQARLAGAVELLTVG